MDAQNFVTNLMMEEEAVGKVSSVPSYSRQERLQQAMDQDEEEEEEGEGEGEGQEGEGEEEEKSPSKLQKVAAGKRRSSRTAAAKKTSAGISQTNNILR